MNSNLATIQKIIDIQPIEGADAIEVATVLGWEVVVKKGEFKIGDLCVYVAIDSVLPEGPEAFEFLRRTRFRIKTVRLRGQLSQGIVFPMSMLVMSMVEDGETVGIKFDTDNEGADVTDLMGVTKYEKPVPSELAGVMKGDFPIFLHKTDEQRVQNLNKIFSNEELMSLEYVATEKIDGTSHTDYLNNGTFGVCSRNLDLEDYEGNVHWELARKLQIPEKLEDLGLNLALQGEAVGPSTNIKYGLKEHKLLYFDAFDIDSHSYYGPLEFIELMAQLELPTVPILDIGRTLPKSLEELIEAADGYSQLDHKQRREGVVYRATTVPSIRSLRGMSNGRISFKAVSNKFLLKYE